MAPYRTTERDETAEAPRDQGIVGDVIAQFADPLAFYRELVQNAIDAGSPGVDITLSYDANHVVARIADRGCGMTRDILENQLLVLFRSTKEQDPTKIGKFGIGFTSVLAPNPAVVVVNTVRDGKRLILHLRPDLTYELFDGGNATQPGTMVELELPIGADAAAAFARRSYETLVKWCRHAQVAVQFSAAVPGLAEPMTGRIDRPFTLDDALLAVSETTLDGKLHAVVGIERTPRTYTGFFNHGLMLHESTEELVGKKISVKLQDARLGHTLSRDNVRRDQHFDEAIAFAKNIVRRRLADAAAVELCAAAEAGAIEDYDQLLRAILATGVPLSKEQWWVPLAASVRDRRAERTVNMPRPLWFVECPNRLATTFAAGNVPVALLRKDIAHRLGAEALEHVFVHVQPIDSTPHDLALVAELQEILEDCKRAPAAILIAELEGAYDTRVAISGGREEAQLRGDSDYILTSEVASRTALGKFTRGTLVLSARHRLIEAARRAADPRVAASHLARVILLGYGILDTKRSERILARGLAALGIGGSK